MSQVESAMEFYERQLDASKSIGFYEIIRGFILSAGLMAGTTFGILVMFFIFNIGSDILTIESLVPITIALVVGSLAASIVALLICLLIIRYPKSISLPLKIHSRLKHGAGEYFLCPEAEDQDLRTVLRRALYGSILVVGIALTVISFDLLVVESVEEITNFGLSVTLLSIFILPFIVMLFFFGPWLIKDSGLFHLDIRDRSLSNVGDDLEDVLEFVAGVDLLLVWLDLTAASLESGFQNIWIPILVFIVAFGPLFSIMINFTLVFMLYKKRATLSLIDMILSDYGVPDMVESSEHIRSRVLGLVDRRMLVEEAIEAFESRKDDLMSTMMVGVEEVQDTPTVESPSELFQIIKKRREELERSYEVPKEMSVTSLKSVESIDEGEPTEDD